MNASEKTISGGKKTESEYLAESIKAVADHYKIAGLDQKTIDWLNLIQCLIIIYGTRIYVSVANARMKNVTPKPAPVATRTPAPAASGSAIPRAPDAQAPTRAAPSNASAPSNVEVPPPPVGEIAGIGKVEFPPDHPLVRKNLN